MKRKFIVVGLSLAIGTGLAVEAFAQAKPEVLVKQRQAAMTLQGKYFGPLAGMAQGKLPYDAKIVARNAEYLDVLSQLPWDGFTAATSGEKSDALPAIYKEPAKFKEAQERLRGAVGKLVAASKAGNEAAAKAAIGEVGKSCGGCHDNFREKH